MVNNISNEFQKLDEEWASLEKQVQNLGKQETTKSSPQAQAPQDAVLKARVGAPADYGDFPLPSDIDDSLPQASWRSGQGQTSQQGSNAMMSGSSQEAAGSRNTQSEAAAKAGDFKAMLGGKAQTGVDVKAAGGFPSLDPSAYAMTLATDDALMSSWDDALKNQQKSKQLIMLLFYVMKQAESGDLNAMYNMMKVLTYIVSKDRALQNIYLGKKLIQLQQMSRQQTQLLMASDTTDAQKFMQTMQATRSEQEAITMSQKLITTMMEEAKDVMTQYYTLTHNIQQADAKLNEKLMNWRI